MIDHEDYICVSCMTAGDDDEWLFYGCPSCECKKIEGLLYEDAPELVAFLGEADHGM